MKNLDYGLGCRLGFPPFLMDFVRGAVPERRIEVGSDRSQSSIHDVTSLIAFLLVWYILLVDEFFPARVALNDICCCAVRGTRRFFLPMRGGHICSWWRCSQRTCTAIPRLDMKNRHTLDGLAVPNRQFCRAFWTNSVRMCSAMA